MADQIKRINKILEDYFGNNLISLAVFGSFCRQKRLKLNTDIDCIIIIKNLNLSQDKISRDIKNRLKYSFPLVAFNIYSQDDFVNILKQNSWFVLTIGLGYKIYFDKNHFFKKTIEKRFQKIKQQRVGSLAWQIESKNFNRKTLDHYLILSERYFKTALLLFRSNFIDIALELLLKSIHCFMIEKSLRRNFFITRGEITQLFFNVYSDKNILGLKNVFLELEQKTNYLYSFDFNKRGNMIFFPDDIKKCKILFIRAKKSFEKLNKIFDNK